MVHVRVQLIAQHFSAAHSCHTSDAAARSESESKRTRVASYSEIPHSHEHNPAVALEHVLMTHEGLRTEDMRAFELNSHDTEEQEKQP
jgi:hypothetical protein